jgi:hypothetical protein
VMLDSRTATWRSMETEVPRVEAAPRCVRWANATLSLVERLANKLS